MLQALPVDGSRPQALFSTTTTTKVHSWCWRQLRVTENIVFSRSGFTEETVLNASRKANADKFIRSLTRGYETFIGPRGYQLSGGQKQRIALARALLGDPPILILDEATSALDTDSEMLISKTLQAHRNRHAILIIAHRLSTVIDADEILVMDNGEVVERGTFQELTKFQGRFAKAWNLQTSKSESE